MEEQKVVVKERQPRFSLPKEVILVKPVLRDGRWLDKSHSGHILHDNAKMEFCVPIDREKGTLIDPLTQEEREFFENRNWSGMDFSKGELAPYNKDNYWSKPTTKVVLRKPQTVLNDDSVLMKLDLSRPDDYLKYAILRANSAPGGRIAPDWDKRFSQGTYRIALVKQGSLIKEGTRKVDIEKTVNKFIYAIDDSVSKMRDFLMIYYLEGQNGRRPPEGADIDWCRIELDRIKKQSLDDIYKVINENKEDYDLKVMINTAIRLNLIKYSKTDGFELMPDGDFMGHTLKHTISYLNDPKNQAVLLRIKNKIDELNNIQ